MSQYSPVTNSLDSITLLVQQIGTVLADAKETMTKNQYEYLRQTIETDFGIDCNLAIEKHSGAVIPN